MSRSNFYPHVCLIQYNTCLWCDQSHDWSMSIADYWHWPISVKNAADYSLGVHKCMFFNKICLPLLQRSELIWGHNHANEPETPQHTIEWIYTYMLHPRMWIIRNIIQHTGQRKRWGSNLTKCSSTTWCIYIPQEWNFGAWKVSPYQLHHPRGGGTSSTKHVKILHSILRYAESSWRFTEIKQVLVASKFAGVQWGSIHPYIVKKLEKSLDMGELTFHAEKTADYSRKPKWRRIRIRIRSGKR